MNNEALRKLRREKKEAQAKLTEEDIKNQKRIKRLIRQGKLPRYCFEKDNKGDLKKDLTLIGTLSILTSK